MIKRFSLHDVHDMNDWDLFVSEHPNGTPFHCSPWLRVLSETYSFIPLLYGIVSGKNELIGVFPFLLVRDLVFGARLVSLPFSDYGGPLLSGDADPIEFLGELQFCHLPKVSYIEIRNGMSNCTGFVQKEQFVRHVVILSNNIEMIKNKLDRGTVQYCIKKARRRNITIKKENSEEGIGEFYRLNQITRRGHGIPVQPALFFGNLYRHIVSKGLGTILIARHYDRPVGGGLFLFSAAGVYYKYNASDHAFMKYASPNHLLTWHAMEDACASGYKIFDFGRTSSQNKGLMRFKAMWGAEALPLPYSYSPVVDGATSQESQQLPYALCTKLWKHIPASLSNKLGPLIFRYMG